MAQLCNLIQSHRDLARTVRVDLDQDLHRVPPLVLEAARIAEANGSISSETRDLLANALGILLSHQSSITGLERREGPDGRQLAPHGTTALFKRLTHSKHGTAFAYEAISLASLTAQPSTAGNGGRQLRLDFARDKVMLSQKYDANYSSSTVEVGRRTIEGDAVIQRDGYGAIAIDAKYSTGSSHGAPEKSQLDGIVSAIAAGVLREFHFVTNRGFSVPAKTAIEDANQRALEACRKSKARITDTPIHDRTIGELSLDRFDVTDESPLICWHEHVWPRTT